MIRIHSIDFMIRKSPGLRPKLIREYCFLQLRILCEIIGLGCLVCHGDIHATKTKSLQKTWNPTEILSRMQELHPDFYPVPVVPVFGIGSIYLDEYKNDYLRKEDLISLWSKSGDHLHKGNFRSLLKSADTSSLRIDDIVNWNQKVINLLENHKISRVGNLFHFIVNINHSVHTADLVKFTINVAIAEAPEILN